MGLETASTVLSANLFTSVVRPLLTNPVHFSSNPEIMDECGLDDNTKKVVISNIKRRMTPQAVKIRSDIEVACYDYEGVDAVKSALREGLNMSTEDMPVRVSTVPNA